MTHQRCETLGYRAVRGNNDVDIQHIEQLRCGSVLYTPPYIPVGLQMDSGSVPGLHMDSTYNTIKAIYFMIIHLESIWSLDRLCLDSTRYQWPPYGVDPFTLPCVIKENPNLRQRSCDLI